MNGKVLSTFKSCFLGRALNSFLIQEMEFHIFEYKAKIQQFLEVLKYGL
jgi:hypothetical protein